MAGWQEEFPRLHAALAPEYRVLPQSQVEQLVESVMGPGMSLADAEGLFDSIGKTFSSIGQAVGKAATAAAPYVVKALPGIASGLMSGMAGGPAGMISGALLGGLGSALGPGGAPPGGPAPGPAPGVPGMPGMPGMPGVPGLAGLAGALGGALGGAGGAGGAIAPFLAALGSPSTQQALQQMLLGPAGAPTVPIAGGTAQAPVSAIAGMLGSMMNRAREDWEAVLPSGQGAYLSEAIDLGNPGVRETWLYEQLLPIPAGTAAAPPAESPEPESPEPESAGPESPEPESAEPEDAGEAGWLDDTYEEEEAYFYAELLRQQAEDEDAEDAEDSELYAL